MKVIICDNYEIQKKSETFQIIKKVIVTKILNNFE